MGLWRYIRRGWNDFRDRLTFVVRNGNTIRIWDDYWCGEEPFSVMFPSLHCIALVPSTKMSEVLNIHNGSLSWNNIFGRGLQNWEVDDCVTFGIFV